MRFFILFNNGNRVFFPGQLVEGTAVLQLTEECSAREVFIRVTGHAKNHWTVSHTHTTTNANGTTTSHTTTDNYDACINVFNGQSKAWGNGTKQKIPAGEHRFPFCFQLPIRCLPSYEGCHGHIRYSIRAEVDRPWKFNHKADMPFTVVTISDLNLMPSLRTPLANARCEKTGLPLFRRGNISIKVSIPKSGFVAGEFIPITIHVDNQSSKDMDCVEAIMKEHVDFVAFRGHCEFPVESAFVHAHGGNERRHSKREVGRLRQPLKIEKHSSASTVVQLRIPAVSASFQCAIIQVYYNLKVTVRSSATFNSSVVSKFPIVVGNVPMQEITVATPYTMPMPQPVPAGPPYPTMGNGPAAPSVYPQLPPGTSNVPTAPPPEYASAPPLPMPGAQDNGPPPEYTMNAAGAPPSYEQSVFGPSAPTKEDEAFAPNYLYFNNLPQMPSAPKT